MCVNTPVGEVYTVRYRTSRWRMQQISGFQAPRLEALPGPTVMDTTHQVKRIEQSSRHGDGTVDTRAALLLAFKGDGLGLEVHALGN